MGKNPESQCLNFKVKQLVYSYIDVESDDKIRVGLSEKPGAQFAGWAKKLDRF